MKIAATYDSDSGNIFQHFGKTQYFNVCDVDDGKITGSQVIDTEGKGHGQLAGFLRENGVEVLICGGIGTGAQEALTSSGIRFYAGVSGNPDEAVKALLAGQLVFDANPHCDHHDHEHNHEHHYHNCGE